MTLLSISLFFLSLSSSLFLFSLPLSFFLRALTMLTKEAVGWASICNAIGQTIGVFLSNQVFLALSDKDWCKTFLRIDTVDGLVDLPQFMIFWGIVFIFFTCVIWIFKHEETSNESGMSAISMKLKAVESQEKVSLLAGSSNPASGTSISGSTSGGASANDMMQTYKDILSLCSLPHMQTFLLILITMKLSYAPLDSGFIFKLQVIGPNILVLS
jgi:hypothetical protein